MARRDRHSFLQCFAAVVIRIEVLVMLFAAGSSAAAGQDVVLPLPSTDVQPARTYRPGGQHSLLPHVAEWKDDEDVPGELIGDGCLSRDSLATTGHPDAEGPFPGNITFPQNHKPAPGFQWGQALKQSLLFTSVMNAFRIATEPSTRADLKGPFFKDYLNSVKRLRGWRDGDEFLINYVGHPMQGSVSGFIYVQNEPDRDKLEPGLRRAYWKSRMKAMGWAFLVSTQFEIGPFSEASLGNVGLKPSEKSEHPMGYIDLVVTPTLGTAWLVGEDTLDRYLIREIENLTTNRVLRALTRSFLNPARSFANLMRFRPTWYRDGRSM
jgi:hypothetical protein